MFKRYTKSVVQNVDIMLSVSWIIILLTHIVTCRNVVTTTMLIRARSHNNTNNNFYPGSRNFYKTFYKGILKMFKSFTFLDVF